MLADCEEVYRSYPWVQEVWLLGPGLAWGADPSQVNLLIVSAVPPREVRPGERRRLLAQLRERLQRPVDMRLTTGRQLSRWTSAAGAFASSFRREAVRLFPRPAGAP
jgi:hypothetical protein